MNTLDLASLPSGVREQILAIAARAKTKRNAITLHQVQQAKDVLAVGSIDRGSAFIGTTTYAFSKVVLKWLSERPNARKMFMAYLDGITADSAGVMPDRQTRGAYLCDVVGCAKPGPFGVPQAVGTHKRLAHGIRAKSTTNTDPVHAGVA